MKLTQVLSLLNHMRFALSVGFVPTLQAVLGSPGLLLRPRDLSRVYMAKLWIVMGDGPDENKDKLITPHAHGVVLDLGAGHGHVIPYLDKTRVTRYIALEPNLLMHPSIRAAADKAGFHEADGSLIILGCGAEDTSSIFQSFKELSSGGSMAQIDTIIAIRTLCTVPNAQNALAALVRDTVKPGGQLLVYEHVRNKRRDVAWWQRFWTPIWSVLFDGCKLDRDTDVWVKELQMPVEVGGDTKWVSIWRDYEMWDLEGDGPDSLLCHIAGRFVRA